MGAEEELEHERCDSAEHRGPALGRQTAGGVGIGRGDGTLERPSQREGEKGGVDQTLDDGLVARRDVLDPELSLQLAEEQFDFPSQGVDSGDCTCVEGGRWGTGQVETMPAERWAPDGHDAQSQPSFGPVTLGEVLMSAPDPGGSSAAMISKLASFFTRQRKWPPRSMIW